MLCWSEPCAPAISASAQLCAFNVFALLQWPMQDTARYNAVDTRTGLPRGFPGPQVRLLEAKSPSDRLPAGCPPGNSDIFTAHNNYSRFPSLLQLVFTFSLFILESGLGEQEAVRQFICILYFTLASLRKEMLRCFNDIFTPYFLPQLSPLALLGCWGQDHPPAQQPQSSSSSFVSCVYHVQMPTSGWHLQFSDGQLINHAWVQGQWFTLSRIWPLGPREGSCCPGEDRGELPGSQDHGFIQQLQTWHFPRPCPLFIIGSTILETLSAIGNSRREGSVLFLGRDADGRFVFLPSFSLNLPGKARS